MEPLFKVCTRCGVSWPFTEYSKHPKNKNGLQSVCRSCNRKYCAERRVEVKQAVLAYFGALCACCGETERTFLTLDHVNNDGAAHRRELGAVRLVSSTDKVYRWLVKTNFAEAERFQILCFNCNCGKRSNGGVCPHKEAK